MAFTLPELPYAMDALEPHMSRETLEFHYGKHHKTYVDKANGMVPGSEFDGQSMEDIIRKSSGGIFNNVAQIWNHSFFWNCLTPGGSTPSAALTAKLEASVGSVDEFKKQFTETAINTFKNFPVNREKQNVPVSQDGYVIGDGILINIE